MTTMTYLKARKAGLGLGRPDDGGGEIWTLVHTGNPLNGTAASDFILALQAGTINGLGGDDLILSDISNFRVTPNYHGSFADAIDLDGIAAIWFTDENPLFADDSVPHATVHILGTNGTQEYFKIVVGAGQTLTIDIDGGGGSLGSASSTDTIVDLFLSTNLVTAVANNDDSASTNGGFGSTVGTDSFLTFTNIGATATYYIRIMEYGGDNTFEADDEFLLNISLTGHATVLGDPQDNDNIIGAEGNDHLFGAGGNDIFNGGTGADLMVGGTGNDFYFVDDSGDLVVEVAGEGVEDIVSAFVDYALTTDASVERLVCSSVGSAVPINLTGSSIGQTIEGHIGANVLRGEGGNDQLSGIDGNDTLIGGAGMDIMIGGTGDDVYNVDDALDSITETSNQGNDTLVASVSYTLATSVSVETMSTTSQAGTAPIALTGNQFAQSVFGNEGNNQLLGLGGNDQLVGYGGNDVLVGGGGIDYLRGGLGNDVYGIGEGDIILEAAGEGDDSLAADIGSYYLNDGASIETLSTANQAATSAQNLTGNELGQSVAGSEGANVLNGMLGNDLLRGYGGADIFLFDTTPGASNHDVIADMVVGVDRIALQNSIFTGLAEGNLGANAFRVGATAGDADDRIIWNAATNQLFYDADGNGAGAQVLFAIVNGSPNLQASDFIVI